MRAWPRSRDRPAESCRAGPLRKKARSREREFVPLLPLEDGTAMLPCKDLSLGMRTWVLSEGRGAVRRPGRCGAWEAAAALGEATGWRAKR